MASEYDNIRQGINDILRELYKQNERIAKMEVKQDQIQRELTETRQRVERK